jgi:tRNA pseudouridine32 synthase/23S rRNA pseudouridine746 synthase
MELEILFEDGEALIINKPAGLPLDQPRAGGRSLEDHLETLTLGFQRQPAPVHRLDRDTSGCLLLARNPKALKRFSTAFEARAVAKRYLGVVNGVVEGEEGTIALSLSKISSAADGWRMIAAKKGKPAITHWRKVKELNGLTLVEFRPETGRTHQIRVHAQLGLGAALVGDPIYGDGEGAARTLLHAVELTVEREGKPPVHALAPIPADFVALGFGEEVAPEAPAPEAPAPASQDEAPAGE